MTSFRSDFLSVLLINRYESFSNDLLYKAKFMYKILSGGNFELVLALGGIWKLYMSRISVSSIF